MKMSALKKVLHDFWWVRKNWEAIAKQKRFWDGRAASNSKRYLNSEPAKEYPFHEGVMWFLMSPKELRSNLQTKRFWHGRAASNSKRWSNSEPAKEYPFHESNNSKEADIDDEPDEGPNPIDNVERRWCS